MNNNEIKLEGCTDTITLKVFNQGTKLTESNANKIFKFFKCNVSSGIFDALAKLFYTQYKKDFVDTIKQDEPNCDECDDSTHPMGETDNTIQEETINITFKELQIMLITNNVDIKKVYDISKQIKKL